MEFERGCRWTGAGGHTLEFTEDGNLELRKPTGELLWESSTARLNPFRLVLKRTGELAICDWRGYPLWSTGTGNHIGAYLALQADGNVVMYSADGYPIWETNTAAR